MSETPTDDVLDVAIVGAGISGIGAARYLCVEHPQRRIAILEGRTASGGTWDLFRYPGIRSDSDLHTFGYDFKPWTDRQAIADAPRILAYLREVVAENDLEPLIRYDHRVVAAAWDSATALWTLDVRRSSGERLQVRARWIFNAGGYYRYDEGFTPTFEGVEDFAGPVVHPQHWPEDLDYAGKRVVVIGSGATAVTLVPAMAETAAHVTMLQRTPTYVMPLPREDVIANALMKALPERLAHRVVRRKNITRQRLFYAFCQRFPKAARALIRTTNARLLPPGYAVDTHFNPPYDPWDQRLCAVPDGDLFRSIRHGRASVVTDRIVRFTARGLLLESGEELPADVVVTATGLNLQPFGGAALTVDGRPVDLAETVAYKGMMLSGVPNLAYAIGYTNSSWTLKIGLLCEHLCRLLRHMDDHGYAVATPVPADPGMPTRPFLDFGAGYVQRVIHLLPRQGDRWPWQTTVHYATDAKRLRGDRVDDPELRFGSAPAPTGSDAVEPELVEVSA